MDYRAAADRNLYKHKKTGRDPHRVYFKGKAPEDRTFADPHRVYFKDMMWDPVYKDKILDQLKKSVDTYKVSFMDPTHFDREYLFKIPGGFDYVDRPASWPLHTYGIKEHAPPPPWNPQTLEEAATRNPEVDFKQYPLNTQVSVNWYKYRETIELHVYATIPVTSSTHGRPDHITATKHYRRSDLEQARLEQGSWKAAIGMLIRDWIKFLLVHELDECLKVEGERVVNPHPDDYRYKGMVGNASPRPWFVRNLLGENDGMHL